MGVGCRCRGDRAIAIRRHLLPLIALVAASVLDATTPAAADPDCRCRYFGRYYHLGDTVCFRTPDGPRVAMCTMNQNVTSWEVSKRACAPMSRLRPGNGATAVAGAFAALRPTDVRPARRDP